MNISTQDATIATAELSTLITDANTAAIASAAARLLVCTSQAHLDLVISNALAHADAKKRAEDERKASIRLIEKLILNVAQKAADAKIQRSGPIIVNCMSWNQLIQQLDADIAELYCLQFVKADKPKGCDFVISAVLTGSLADCFNTSGNKVFIEISFCGVSGEDEDYIYEYSLLFSCRIECLYTKTKSELMEIHDKLVLAWTFIRLSASE